MTRRLVQSELKTQTFLVSMISVALTACGGGGGGGGGAAVPDGGGGGGGGGGSTPGVSGNAIKGPLENANVFIDTDGDGVRGDNDSPIVTTDSDGAFTTAAGFSGDLIVQTTADTIDTFAPDTPLDGLVLKAPSGYSVVSPATTLTSAILESNDGLTAAQAEQRVKDALGLGDVDLETFNPFDDVSSEAARIYEKKAQQIVSIANSISQLTVSGGGSKSGSFSDALGSIAEVLNSNIQSDPSSVTDLASGAIIGDVIDEMSDPDGDNYNAAFATKVEAVGTAAIESMKAVIAVVNTAIDEIEDISSAGDTLAKIQNIVASEASKVAEGIAPTVTSLDVLDNYVTVAGIKNLEFDENGTLTQEVTLTIVDPDASDETSYTFSTTPTFSNGRVIGGDTISSPLGTLTVSAAGVVNFSVDASAVDFLTDNQTLVQNYTVSILDNGGNEVGQEVIRVAVSGINDAPVITSDNSISVFESVEPGETILQLTASDAENDAITFALTGDDASAFSLADNGALSFVTSPNFATKSAYALGVQATDANGASSDSNLVVSVVDSDGFIRFDTTNEGQDYSTVVTLNFEDLNNFNSQYDLSNGLTGFVVGLEAVQGWDVISGKAGGAIGSWASSLTGDTIEISTELDVAGQTTFRVAVLSNDGSNIAGSNNEMTLGTLSYTVAQGVEDFDLTLSDSYISTFDPMVRIDMVDYTVDII